MGRRAAREIAMKLLYQLEIQKDDSDSQISKALEDSSLSKNDAQYVTSIIKTVTENLDKIDRTIGDHSKGWKLGRISKVDLSILRLSIGEIFYRDDIPCNVSINEAVELAKKA
jgi:N utilization substance protein B